MVSVAELLLRAHQEAWNPWTMRFERDAADWAEKLGEVQRKYLEDLLYSQLYGEYEVLEGVARLSRLVGEEEVRLFLLTHARDNTVHADLFERYLRDVARARVDWRAMEERLPGPYVKLISRAPRALLRRLEAGFERGVLGELLVLYYLLADGILYNTSYVGLQETVWRRGWLEGLQRAYEIISRDEKRQTLFGALYLKALADEDPTVMEVVKRAMSRYGEDVIATIGHFAPLIESFGLALDRFIEASRDVIREELEILGLRW